MSFLRTTRTVSIDNEPGLDYPWLNSKLVLYITTVFVIRLTLTLLHLVCPEVSHKQFVEW